MNRPLLLLLLLPAMAPAVLAHRLDEYLQGTIVVIDPREIRLQIDLTPGVAVADKVLALIDRDHDGVITTNEAAAYVELVRRDLTARMDQRAAELKVNAFNFPQVTELRTGLGIIQIELAMTPTPLSSGPHTLTLENRHLPKLSVYLVNAAMPASDSVKIVAQKRNQNQSLAEIDFEFHPPPTVARNARTGAMSAALLAAFFAGAWIVRSLAGRQRPRAA